MAKNTKQDGLNLFIPFKKRSAVSRNTRFATSIKKIIADIIMRNDFPTRDCMIKKISATIVTVTHVHVTEDLRNVTVYVSPFDTSITDDIVVFYNSHKHYFKDVLAQKACMRYMPEITFKCDTSIEDAQKIEKLLSEC